MHGDQGDHDASKPTVFATQSTHKLLAALSLASFIHVRDGCNPIEHARFNEAFVMHASTSPQYAIIASNDVSAAMMDGAGGASPTTEAIREAVAFRQMLSRMHAGFSEKADWFLMPGSPNRSSIPGRAAVTPFTRRARICSFANRPICRRWGASIVASRAHARHAWRGGGGSRLPRCLHQGSLLSVKCRFPDRVARCFQGVFIGPREQGSGAFVPRHACRW